MVAATSRFAYLDCYDLLERAMDDDVGVRVKFDTREEAVTFRARIHKARSIDREDNKAIKKPEDPLYARSEYDKLFCRIIESKEGHCWVYVEKRSFEDLEIENLSEVNNKPIAAPPKTITMAEIRERVDDPNHRPVRRG